MPEYQLISYQGKKWPDELTETVKTDWQSGLSASQIGRKHGLSRNAIIGKIHRIGLPKRPQDERKKSVVVVTKKRYRPNRVRKPPPPKPKVVDLPTAVQIAAKLEMNNPGISILKLVWIGGKPANCRAVLRYDADNLPLYCGEATVDGASFCDCHCALYYNHEARSRESKPFRLFR